MWDVFHPYMLCFLYALYIFYPIGPADFYADFYAIFTAAPFFFTAILIWQSPTNS